MLRYIFAFFIDYPTWYIFSTCKGIQLIAFVSSATCFVTGDGRGDREKYLGRAPNREECKRMVRAREPAANGATFPNICGSCGSGNCYAEFGMNGVHSSSSWQTCLFEGMTVSSLRSFLSNLRVNFIQVWVSFKISETCFVTGDGIGGTEELIGAASNREECKRMVRAREPAANGATFPTRNGRGNCYAEFGMTRASSSSSYQTCQFEGINVQSLYEGMIGSLGFFRCFKFPSFFSYMFCYWRRNWRFRETSWHCIKSRTMYWNG